MEIYSSAAHFFGLKVETRRYRRLSINVNKLTPPPVAKRAGHATGPLRLCAPGMARDLEVYVLWAP